MSLLMQHLLIPLLLPAALAQMPSGPTAGGDMPLGQQQPVQQQAPAQATAPSQDQDPNLAPSKTEKSDSPVKPALAPKANPNGVVSITKVVGEIGDAFVTSREVKINNAVELAMTATATTPSESFKILSGVERTFPSEVTTVLDEWAVYFEARSLGSTDVAKADVAKATLQVEERWNSKQSWKDLEVGTEELRVLIERKLASKEFEKLKSDPALSPISDDEALTYYKKNRLRFGSLPYSSFEQNIKSYLVKNQVEKRLTEWHDVLRRKYKSRNFISG